MIDENDGGYYAIKGFLYQFDKALIEVLRNPQSEVGIEQRQDIDYQDFVIQVKHKETQEYKDYKIKKPVQKLIEMFKTDQTQKICLYCYFYDRPISKWILKTRELNSILGDQAGNYSSYLKSKFIKGFYIQFSYDYETQFLQLIDLIKSSFSLVDGDVAYFYHSLLRSKLLDISVREKKERHISRHNLDEFIGAAEKTLFYEAYSKYLDKAKYERLVKKEFFTLRTANLDNFERLFIVQCDEEVSTVELHKIVTMLIHKYYRMGKSPQPYLCFTYISEDRLVVLKQDLLDQGISFDDGTYFNGDRFRLERIIDNRLSDNKIWIKIVDHQYLDRVLSKIKFHEVYQFYLNIPLDIELMYSHTKIQVEQTVQMLRMVN